MKPAKIFKFFKKGARAVSGKKEKPKGPAYKWPHGLRIGVYGHANSGKTVYFTTLNEDSKVSKRLQTSVTDSNTASEFLANYRNIWGLGTASTVGTVVDLKGEQKFPDPTEDDKVLQFNAILDRSKKLSVITYDYNGSAVSISDTSDLKEKVLDFFDGANGIIFFYDPKVMGAEVESHAHVASFVTLLERIVPLSSRLPIPIALVVTKADVLPGFSGENQVILVNPEDEDFFSQDYELFLDKVLSSNQVASNSEWAGSVRSVLVKLKEFLKVVVGRTLDFQIFFVSNVGQSPEKIGTEVGRSIYKPPRILRPVGIQEPFYWILRSVIRSRRIRKLRRFTKFIVTLSILWMLVYSLPFAYHFKYLLPLATRMEDNILENYSGNMLSVTQKERSRIRSQYDRYSRAWTVKWIFPKFVPVSQNIREIYGRFDIKDAIKKLDGAIARFTAVVSDPNLWPTYNPKDSQIVMNDDHEQLQTDLAEFLEIDSSSVLFKRSDRVYGYWELFKQSIGDLTDTTVWGVITRQVETDQGLYAGELSRAEDGLMNALSAKKVVKVQRVTSQQAGVELDELIEEINGNKDPEYRLDAAATKLKEIRGQIGSGDGKNMINRYLANVKRWTKDRQTFRYRVEKVPDDGVLYIEVTSHGSDPGWEKFQQIYQDEEYKIEWKVGDDIHIGFCEVNKECNRGADPSDKIVLSDEYSLFAMEKDLHFTNINKHVTLRFKPGLIEQLPELK